MFFLTMLAPPAVKKNKENKEKLDSSKEGYVWKSTSSIFHEHYATTECQCSVDIKSEKVLQNYPLRICQVFRNQDFH